MSKIAEKRTDEIVGEFHDGDYTDHSRHNTQWVAFKQGYDQAMQDFLEWLKDCSTFTYSNGYKRIDDDLYNKLVEDFKTTCKMKKCKDCKEYACIKRSEDSNCFFEEMYDYAENEEEELYWEHFRAEAAKDILCAMICSTTYCFAESTIDSHTDRAIRFVDKLISKLKENEEK